MASSNRHWPSMFKSKPRNNHQWQHDINSCHRSPYSLAVSGGGEERTPDPKPRWNPKPEQIRILEAIFNSGMVNPPRDEIRKIRAQLQEFGQVGDANVFYWFQNRKSRSKHKQRHLQNTKKNPATAPSNSSSSSSDKSSLNSTEKLFPSGSSSTNIMDLSNSPTASVNQTFFQTQTDHFLTEPFLFPTVQQSTGGGSGAVFTQGLSFSDVSGTVPDHVIDHTVGNCSNILLGDLMLMNHAPSPKKPEVADKIKMQELINYSVTSAPTATHLDIVPPSFSSVPSPPHHVQGAGAGAGAGIAESGGGEGGPTKSTVFINDVCFEVSSGIPFNVREAFGEEAVLVHSSGQPVLTNEWGVTLHPLFHGAFYYLIMRTFSPSPVDRTIDLI